MYRIDITNVNKATLSYLVRTIGAGNLATHGIEWRHQQTDGVLTNTRLFDDSIYSIMNNIKQYMKL